MWYLYLMIGVAAVCIGVPLFLIYWTDKRSKGHSTKETKGHSRKETRNQTIWQIWIIIETGRLYLKEQNIIFCHGTVWKIQSGEDSRI